MRRASLGSAILIALIVCFAITGTAAAAASIEELDAESLLGKPVFSHEFDVSERLIGPTNVTISFLQDRMSYGASRFVLGERGVFVKLGFESVFLPQHAFTMIEISDTNVGARIESFEQEVLWRGSWSGQRRGIGFNFSYRVDGVTQYVFAQDALITPDFLVVSLNDGHMLRIIKYETVERIEVVH